MVDFFNSIVVTIINNKHNDNLKWNRLGLALLNVFSNENNTYNDNKIKHIKKSFYEINF